jgi:hypothetical protein
MNDAEKAAFADRVKRAVAAAAARGLHAWGYEVRGGYPVLWTRPAERRRKVGPAPDQTGVRPMSRRGIAADGRLAKAIDAAESAPPPKDQGKLL